MGSPGRIENAATAPILGEVSGKTIANHVRPRSSDRRTPSAARAYSRPGTFGSAISHPTCDPAGIPVHVAPASSDRYAPW